ncbi:hypothetical protein AWI24_23585 [Enterobacter hormaechei subsp. steigerwaltii]|nr:hypothetical protein AWI24_23585 [Enterobacter hormaechei subsp. steigerwaltii]
MDTRCPEGAGQRQLAGSVRSMTARSDAQGRKTLTPYKMLIFLSIITFDSESLSLQIYRPHRFLLKTVSMIGKHFFAFIDYLPLKRAVRICAAGALTTAGRCKPAKGFSRGLTGGITARLSLLFLLDEVTAQENRALKGHIFQDFSDNLICCQCPLSVCTAAAIYDRLVLFKNFARGII